MKKFLSLMLVCFLLIGSFPLYAEASEVAESIAPAETTSVEETIPGETTSEEETAAEEQTTEEIYASETISIAAQMAGTCGDHVNWTLNNGVLHITGTGEMQNFDFDEREDTPWYSQKDEITSIVIDNGVTGIGDHVFDNCTNVTSVSIPASVKRIGESAFYECKNLQSVVVPDGVTALSDFVFGGCESLNSVTLPDSVTSIGQSAFYKCESLTAVQIPSGVTSIGKGAFSWCTNLKSIVIPDGVTKLKEDTFYDCTELEDVRLPDSITRIGSYAFYSCGSLKEIVLPSKLYNIDEKAFDMCGLTSVTIPADVIKIDKGAFSLCFGMESVYFEGDAPIIGTNAFEHVTMTAYYPRNNSTWTNRVRGDYGGKITWEPYDPHIHSYTAIVTPPTCVEKGYTTHTCTGCGDSYVDAETKATGHTEVIDEAVEATCTKDGLTEGKRCSVCGTVIVKQEVIAAKGHVYNNDQDATCNACGERRFVEIEITAMHRLYNPNSGEHFYTANVAEKDMLVGYGWAYEGIAWYAPTEVGEPVYRLYNPNAGEHHYTISAAERDMLVSVGWIDEGIGWLTADDDQEPVYRVYNPNEFANNHHYTRDANERDWLVSLGWVDEGIGWYGVSESSHVHAFTSDVTKPTCMEAGYTTYTCTCGYSYVGDEVPALGGKHNYLWEVGDPTDDGYAVFTCDICGDMVSTNPENCTHPEWIDFGHRKMCAFCGTGDYGF